MASGGARPRSGPAPDPTALRRDRKNDQATWVTLPSSRPGPAPDWPLAIEPGPTELIHWKRLWASPQANQWEKNGQEYEVAIYVRTLAEAEIPGAAANLRTLVKQLQENLGLSYVGLLKFHWRIAEGEADVTPITAATANTGPARTRPSAKERFKVIETPAASPEED